MKRLLTLTMLLSGAALAACSKDAVLKLGGPTSGSNIKFFNFSVAGPSVNFYANDTKVTAISSTSCTPPASPPTPACTTTGLESTTGTASGAAGNAGLYSSVAPGSYAITGRISATTDNGLQVGKLSTSLADGKYYSYFVSGIYDPVAKTADSFIVEDPFPADVDLSGAYVRFVNASPNASPMTLWAKNTVTGDSVAIGGPAAYKAGGAFVKIPTAVYDLTGRYAGSNTGVIIRTAVSFSLGRVYTVAARGDMTVSSTTSANRPQFDNTANR